MQRMLVLTRGLRPFRAVRAASTAPAPAQPAPYSRLVHLAIGAVMGGAAATAATILNRPVTAAAQCPEPRWRESGPGRAPARARYADRPTMDLVCPDPLRTLVAF